MPEVYVCKVVADVRELYRSAPISKFNQTIDIVSAHAEILFETHQAGKETAAFQFRNWHPELVGKEAELVMAADIQLADAQLTLSREFGFESWDSAHENSKPIDQEFEQAVDLTLAGEIDQLSEMISKNPGLVKQTSSFGHASTLLIYLAANGVETWRQVVPMNAVEVAKLLLDKGADPRATANVYGGKFDALALAETSAHPREAGILKSLAEVLQ